MNMQDVQLRQFGEWPMRISQQKELFPVRAVRQAQNFLESWSTVFPHGNTWVGKEFGVPSLIVRFDCIVDTNGDLRIYELEDRPCGIGIGGVLFPHFKESVESVKNTWPAFRWVRAVNRPTDDEYWSGPGLTLEEAHATDTLLLVRTRPDHPGVESLESRAISTVRFEGCKAYGEKLGLWTRANRLSSSGADTDSFAGFPHESCVIKPIQGTRGFKVGFYLVGDEDHVRFGNRCKSMSPKDLQRRIRKDGSVFCQPLIPPMERDHVPGMGMIYRIYFGFDCSAREYVPLGGVWMANKGLLVHGSPDTVTGPLFLE